MTGAQPSAVAPGGQGIDAIASETLALQSLRPVSPCHYFLVASHFSVKPSVVN